MTLAKRVSKLKPSPTLAIDAKAKAMIAQGIDVVNFGVGEPDFDTPDNVKEAAVRAINNGFTKYTAVGGIDELKEAIIKKLSDDNNLSYSKNQIIVSCGAKHSLYNIAQVLFDRGDEVIIPAPYWVSYPDQIILNDAKPVILNTKEDNGFMLSTKELKKKITKKTKAIILNSPSNPTGSAYDKNIVEEIAEIAVKKKIFIISDEIYEKIVYNGFKHVSIASLNEKIKNLTILVNGLSKSHSMTGWRIGYAAGPDDIISAMNKVQSQSTSNPTSISQKAAVEALNGPQDFTAKMLDEFDKRRRYIVERLNKIKGVTCAMPKGAFYAFPNVSNLYGKRCNGKKIKGSSNLANYFLDKAQAAVVAGDAFGADDYIRFSYATSMDNIKKGIDRIEGAINSLD